MIVSRRTLLQGAAASALLPTRPALASAPSREVVLTLLHTNDLHGHAYLPGKPQGLTQLAPLVQQIRAEMPNVVLLDAGDIIHGMPEEKEFKNRPLLTAMNALRYDAATVGNHEFDFGQDRTRDAIAFSRFPMLSANVVERATGKPWGGLKPYIVLERGGARVGIFGLTTPTTVSIEWPRTLAGIQFTDPHEAASRMVSTLRQIEKVDLVIALSHLGYLPDWKMAEEVSGIDLIIGGHSHTALKEQVWIKNTLIQQTGAYGNALGRIDVLLRPAGDKNASTPRIVVNGTEDQWWGQNGIAAPLAKSYPTGPLLLPTAAPSPEAENLRRVYLPFWSDMDARLKETLTTAVEPLPALEAVKRETPIGNLIADAVRAQAKSDVALASSSLIQAKGLDAGPVSVRDLYTLLGSYTRQHIVVVRVSGDTLQKMLAALRADTEKLPAHLSGALVRGNTITVAGRLLAAKETYTVAAAAHVIQDHLLGKPGVEVVSDDVLAPTVRDALIVFLRGHVPLSNKTEARWG